MLQYNNENCWGINKIIFVLNVNWNEKISNWSQDTSDLILYLEVSLWQVWIKKSKVLSLVHIIIHCPEEGEGNNAVILLHVCLITKDLTYTEN